MTQRSRIMVVDDEIANIEMIGAVLEEEYEVLFARSGEQAIELARRSRPDLILLDVVMPGMNGYDTCRRFKQDPATADVPIIFTTGLDGVESEVEGLSLGAVDYLTKPIRPASLQRRIDNHLGLKQLRDRLASLATLDPLTGLGNRRMLDAAFGTDSRRLSEAERDEWRSIILVDIDYFKGFNDLYGHGDGDICIRRVAECLIAGTRRDRDICVRYGGEEFACILHATSLPGAIHIAEKMRQDVQEMMIPHSGSEISDWLSISVGLVSGRVGLDLPMTQWLEQADQQLYQSKHGGRNRVTGRELAGR
ncbi:diguanylate cyclase [Paracoccus aurantiacus]|uniref:diguanylate cyclase n=1 Tax=Paracoccus aurantiacus TaxID=2599412 RepID=A0A5C6SA00_9RHOB|nr:diguanylate cyclase [Paracoccus aurantiacus]TXB71238.1 diguanylate cyclase [Paracoccus aurantiacus]